MLFQKDDIIGNYTVSFPYKQEACAETYRVKDPEGHTCFLKLIDCSKLRRDRIDNEGQVVEIEVAKLLDHHNLLKYRDSGRLTFDGRLFAYLVTDYVSSETLAQRIIRDDDISVYEIKGIAKAVLFALAYMHTRSTPIIHNGVTINNVLLDLTGSINDLKLVGLGSSQFFGTSLAKPDLKSQNLFYIAPERFSGVSSVQSDLYSVGVMIYHLLYGRLPWFVDVSRVDSQDIIDVILAEHDKELDLPMLNKFELDDQLLNVIAKAVSYDAEDRFQTAEEFIRAIDGKTEIPRQSTKTKILSDAGSRKQATPKFEKAEGEGFAAIAGMEELKRQLREEVIEPLHNPEEYRRYGVTIPNGMLLYGPPGCGKTFFAKHFAEEVGFNFLCITPATLKSRYVNATQENIAQMFKEAEEKAPTVIFIDEMNELVPDRQSDVHEMSRSAVNEMLAQMDRTGEKGVFIIGATNYPDMIDPAILRAGRLDKKYYVGAPDKEARAALFQLYLCKRPYDFGLDYDKLAELTEYYVSADIQLIVNEASRNALHRHSRITMELLTEAIRNTLPSLSREMLSKYESIKVKKEGSDTPARRRVGF